MADGPAEAVATIAAEAAANAGAVVANVEADAARMVAASAERVERAETAAQAVVDAAVQTAVGQRVETVEQELEEWETAVENQISKLMTEVRDQQSQLNQLSQKLTELGQVTVTQTTVQPAGPSILKPLPEAGAVTTVETVAPASASNAPIKAAPEASAVPKRRWI